MIGVSVTGVNAVAARLREAAADVRKAQDDGIRRASIAVQRDLRLEVSQAGGSDPFWGKTGSAGSGLAVRSGRTRQSIVGGGAIYRAGNNVTAAVGSPEKHLALHEVGGTVKGTSSAGYARVPTGAALTGAGVDRWLGTSIRNIPGAFLFTSKAGKLWAALRGAAGKSLTLLYLLVRSIHLKPRHIFARVRDRNQSTVAAIIGTEISVATLKANR